METADLIVIGSGQGGIPLATDFAREGRNVVLFERDVLGGSCVNYGCTPSKAFLAAAHAAGRARQAEKLGISIADRSGSDVAATRALGFYSSDLWGGITEFGAIAH